MPNIVHVMQHEKHFPGKMIHKKSYTKWGGEISLKPKKSEFSMSWDQQTEVLHSLFLLYVQVEGSQKILKLRCRPLAFTSNNASL